MPCDTIRTRGQTIAERAAEVKAIVERIARGIIAGIVKPVVSKDGAIAFGGISDRDRDGVTDACVYRRVMASGSVLAQEKIKQAERIAGKTVDRAVIGNGHGARVHSHDGGVTWHKGH